MRPHATLLVAAVSALMLLAVARERPVALDLDTRLERARRGWPSGVHEAGQWLDRLGGHWVLPPIVTAAVLLAWWRGRRGDAVRLVAASAGADAALHLLKVAVDTDRPGEGVTLPAGASFPSGHATTALTIAVTLAVVATRGARSATRRAAVGGAVVVATAVGGGRWLDGLRAASDVAGGLALGAALLAGSALFLERRATRAREAR